MTQSPYQFRIKEVDNQSETRFIASISLENDLYDAVLYYDGDWNEACRLGTLQTRPQMVILPKKDALQLKVHWPDITVQDDTLQYIAAKDIPVLTCRLSQAGMSIQALENLLHNLFPHGLVPD